MNEDRRTKTQILAELESAQKTVRDLEKRIPEPPRVVPAAAALAGCIRALDAIGEDSNPRRYGGFSDNPRSSEVQNVLEHLMRRYQVDLTVRTVEPCARLHLDDATDADVLNRLRGFNPMGGF